MATKRTSGPVRFAIYLRCSTDDQKHGDYTTIDTQRELDKRHTAAQGGVFVKEYADEGKSGTNLSRPGWKALLADAQAGQFDAVCLTYMSRLARGEAYHVAEYLLKEAGVKIVLVQEHFTPDLAGHVNKQMTILMDGMYPKMVSQWTKTKMEQMVARGYHCGGITPFGYMTQTVTDAGDFVRGDKAPPKRLVPHPEQADIARHAFSVFMDRGTIAAVREYLNAVSTRHWTTTSVKNLLRSETYVGVQNFGEWRNEIAHPALVERGTWQQVQDTLTNRRPVATARGTAYNYFLRGLLHCPHCGCIYTPWPSKGGTVAYYGCQSHQKKKTVCPVGRINADALHYTLLHEIEYAAKHQTVMHRLIAESGGWQKADTALTKLRADVSKKKQFVGLKISNLNKAIAEGSTSYRSLLVTLERMEMEEAQLGMELRQLDEEISKNTFARPEAKDVAAYWAEFVELWPELTDAEKLEMIGHLVLRVEVTQKNSIYLELAPVGGKCCSSVERKFLTTFGWEREGKVPTH